MAGEPGVGMTLGCGTLGITVAGVGTIGDGETHGDGVLIMDGDGIIGAGMLDSAGDGITGDGITGGMDIHIMAIPTTIIIMGITVEEALPTMQAGEVVT